MAASRAPLAVLSRLASALHRRSPLEGVKLGKKGGMAFGQLLARAASRARFDVSFLSIEEGISRRSQRLSLPYGWSRFRHRFG
eukprot:scaffold843_cov330-Pavlova_lutheri.AAC.19